MDKYFVCLANSYKRGGRCVAGIEVTPTANGQWMMERHQNGNPRWIRPIADTQYGEIPNFYAFHIKLLFIVKLMGVEECPVGVHCENVRYSQLEVCQLVYPEERAVMNQFVDTIHQSVFGSRGKAVSSDMVHGLDYSLMFIHVQNANAYIDENREKSKNRMKFSYFGTEYDLPITDPTFLDEFRKRPEQFANIPDVYLTLSLGLEYEGWHHKLVAGVIIPADALQNDSNDGGSHKSSWFDEYEQKMAQLLDQKSSIEEQICELRQKLLKQMECMGVDKVHSRQFSVCYTPAKTVMQFDSKAFRTENEELYSSYCKPKQKEASIIVKRNKPEI